MKPLLTFIQRELLYNGHLQSIGAAGVVAITTKLLFDKFAPLPLVFATYFLFEAIFIFDRYYDLDWDAQTNSDRTKHLSLYRKKIPYIITGAVLIFSSIFLLHATLLMTTVAWVVLIFGLFYPIFFKRITRYVPLFKNIYVSAVYAILPVFPAIYFGELPARDILAIHLPIVIFTESVIAQILLDTKDHDSDKAEGLKTLSVLWGNKRTFIVAGLLSGTLAIVSGVVSYLTHAPDLFLFMTVSAFALDIYIIFLVKSGNKNGYFLAAGKFLVWFAIFLISSIVL